MGTNVYNDILLHDEKGVPGNGTKVVIVYTTAGNLNDDDDTKSCDCKDSREPKTKIPYWQVRETGARNSIHLAAARIGGWGPGNPYPEYKTVKLNGHRITRYNYKNTVSYFLRLKAGAYGKWFTEPGLPAGTIDNAEVYDNAEDLAETLYQVFQQETENEDTGVHTVFNFPDTDRVLNPGDHNDHIVAGRATIAAVKILSNTQNKCFTEDLFVDYNTKAMPVNLSTPDIQNEAGLTAVYCLALLDYNAWPEWGSLYAEWTSRNYFRTVNTCPNFQRERLEKSIK